MSLWLVKGSDSVWKFRGVIVSWPLTEAGELVAAHKHIKGQVRDISSQCKEGLDYKNTRSPYKRSSHAFQISPTRWQ